MLDKDLTNVDEAQGMPLYVDGTDSEEDIDEAALMYVIGYDATGRDAGSDMPAGSDYAPDAEGEEGTVTQNQEYGSRDSSWRESLQTEDADRFKRARARERNMRAMSNLWNRLFPIDYDALPLAEYVTVAEGMDGVPEIPLYHSGDSDALSSGETLSVAEGAVVAGLGLGNLADALSDVAGEGNAGREPTQSDTSNRDTVMIGNSTLSDALADIASRRGTHWKESAESPDEETTEERSPADENESQTTEEASLPDDLESLYDEAIGMFAAIDAPSSAQEDEGSNPDDATTNDIDDQFELEDGDVSFPEDGISVASDSVSEDYRGNASPEDIYASDEWKEIEQEIQESQATVMMGLGQLDVLAGVSEAEPRSDDGETQDELPVTADWGEEAAAPATDLSADGDGLASVTEELPSEDLPQAEETVTETIEGESEPSDDEATTPEADAPDISVSLSEEQAPDSEDESAPDQVDFQAEEGSLFQRIKGFFRKQTPEGTDTVMAEAPAQPAEDEAEEQETVAMLLDEVPVPEIPEEAQDQETEPMPASEVQVWEDIPEDGLVAEVGDDYRTIQEPEDPNITDELRDFGDDEIIVMKDDEPTSEDYREESSADSPTEPMPVEEAYGPAPSHEPSQEADAGTRLGTQRIHMGGNGLSLRGIGKARLKSLEIDVSPELMLPLPTSRNGQIDANIKVKTSEFLNPKRASGRSSHVRLSVRPSKARLGAVSVLPAGTGYLPERSPIGSRLKEQGRYEYEPIRRIGEPVPKQ